MACGSHNPRPTALPHTPPPAYGAVPDAGARVVLHAVRFEALLQQLDVLLGERSGEGVGPLGTVWIAFRQRFADGLEDVFGGDTEGVAAWGVDPESPLVVTLASVDAPARVRVLLQVLRVLGQAEATAAGEAAQPALDEALSGAPPALWHARASFRLRDPEALRLGLTRLSARLGHDAHSPGAAPAPWIADVPLPGDVLWIGRDPEAGLLVVARARGGEGAVDVVVPAGAVPAGPLLEVATQLGDPWPAGASGALEVTLRVPEMAPLEAGFVAHVALDAATVLDGAARVEVLTDAARVTASCASRWRTLGGIARTVSVRVDVGDTGPTAGLDAELTPGGARLWAEALTRPALSVTNEIPAGFAVGLARDAFAGAAAELPATASDFLEEIGACGPAHPFPALMGAAIVLPALLDLAWLPLPQAPSGPLVDGSLEGAAGVVLGFERIDGDAVPQVGAIAIAAAASVPQVSEPLGAEADLDVTALGPRWTLDGPGLPVGFARQTRPEGREAVLLALGTGALARLEALIAAAGQSGGETTFLEVWADPSELSRRLVAADRPGPGADALALFGRRLGRAVVRGTLAGGRLEYRLSLESPAPP